MKTLTLVRLCADFDRDSALMVFVFRSCARPGLHRHALTQEELGSVHFDTSCTKAVADDFTRAVALLHSFQYEKADQTFTQVAAKDPNCAMAQWGVAMANDHGLWDNGDMDRGRAALNKSSGSPRRRNRLRRERRYIAAPGEIYKQDGKESYAHG